MRLYVLNLLVKIITLFPGTMTTKVDIAASLNAHQNKFWMIQMDWRTLLFWSKS